MNIERAYVVYTNGKGYLDIFLIVYRGIMINTSKKLSLVTISSTETEVVSNSKYF